MQKPNPETTRREWEPLSPACEPCPEPKRTCFPGPCKLYRAGKLRVRRLPAAITQTARTRAQWSNTKPDAVAAGSEAQVLFCLQDARSDILRLWARIDQLEWELEQRK